jgi:PAS domain S-box-containing protein
VPQKEVQVLRDLLDQAPLPVWVNHQDRVAYINRAGAKLLGALKPDDITCGSVLTFIHTRSLALAQERMNQVLAGQNPEPGHEMFLRLDGSPVEVEVTSWRIPFAGDYAIQSTFADLTAQRKADRAMRDTAERLQAALLASGTGTFRWDVQSGLVDGDDNLRRLFRLSGNAAPLHHQVRDLLAQSALIETAKLAPMYNEKLKEVHRKAIEKGGHRNRATLAVARKLAAYLMAADRAFFASQREALGEHTQAA